MNTANNTQAATTVKARAAYLVKQDARQRFSFGKVWNQAVLEGKVTDQAKLVAHAVKLKAGRKSDLTKLRPETLLAKVQKALTATAAAPAADAAPKTEA